MDKSKEGNNEKPRERINQFIIECMFSKYFEERHEKEIVGQQEPAQAETKVAV
jgi:hypothetical protein